MLSMIDVAPDNVDVARKMSKDDTALRWKEYSGLIESRYHGPGRCEVV